MRTQRRAVGAGARTSLAGAISRIIRKSEPDRAILVR
jgi:hypothetical protein